MAHVTPDSSVYDLHWPGLIRRVFLAHQVKTFRDLCNLTTEQVLMVSFVGEGTLKLLTNELARHKMRLRMWDEPPAKAGTWWAFPNDDQECYGARQTREAVIEEARSRAQGSFFVAFCLVCRPTHHSPCFCPCSSAPELVPELNTNNTPPETPNHDS